MKNTMTYLLTLSGMLLCSGCLSVPTGYGPDGTYADLTAASPADVRRDITFSVDFTSDLGPETWFSEEEIIKAVRTQLTESGLFRKVSYVLPQNASDYHFAFKVSHTGTDVNARMGLGVLCGLTLTALPVWVNNELNWSLSVQSKGKEVYAASSQQGVTDIYWGPFIVASPFMNHLTLGGGMKKKPLRYFVREIRTNRLNERY